MPRRSLREYIGQQSGRGGSIGRVLSRLGRVGKLIRDVASLMQGGGDPQSRDINEAIELLERSGYSVTDRGQLLEPPIAGPPQLQAPHIPAAIEIPMARPVPRAQTVGGTTGGFGPEITVDTRKRLPGDPYDERYQDLTEWKLTPDSSNVYAFAYDYSQGFLYVVFKAAGNPRPNSPGTTYSYGGARNPVPANVYEGFLRTASAGRFVWDKLRVRGTIHGHQYPYTVVSAGPTGYVPRKATRRGFRTRTIAQVRRVGPRRRKETQLIRSQKPERLWR